MFYVEKDNITDNEITVITETNILFRKLILST